jgi:CHAT domain-containing protein
VEDADDSLVGARYEGYKITDICNVKEHNRLRGRDQATMTKYRQLLSQINRLHSSHHAISRWDNPLESALILADGEITLGDLLLGKRYLNLDEVFLSACETHVGTYTLTDDIATITTGFLCAGARSVQSTLWSVDDIVTALFSIFYYQERREGFNRATSLQRAQVRLRNLSSKEFQLNHYPELVEFMDGEKELVQEEIDRLNGSMSNLTPKTEPWYELKEQIRKLVEGKGKLEGILKKLKDYNNCDKPFESPFYWAGFICQGMA